MRSAGARGAVQIAYFVAEAEATAQCWAREIGAGPFFVAEHIALTRVVYRGQETSLDHTSAYGQWGDVMVEFVQQNCTNDSVFSNRPYGVHHVARFATDLDAELAQLAQAGFATAMTAESGAVRFAFVDGNANLGHFLELYQDAPQIREFYAAIRTAADGWDGRDGVRPIHEL